MNDITYNVGDPIMCGDIKREYAGHVGNIIYFKGTDDQFYKCNNPSKQKKYSKLDY